MRVSSRCGGVDGASARAKPSRPRSSRCAASGCRRRVRRARRRPTRLRAGDSRPRHDAARRGGRRDRNRESVERMVAPIRTGRATIDRSGGDVHDQGRRARSASVASRRSGARCGRGHERDAARGRASRSARRAGHGVRRDDHAFCARLLRERPVEAGSTPLRGEGSRRTRSRAARRGAGRAVVRDREPPAPAIVGAGIRLTTSARLRRGLGERGSPRPPSRPRSRLDFTEDRRAVAAPCGARRRRAPAERPPAG